MFSDIEYRIKVYSDIRYNVGLCALQSGIADHGYRTECPFMLRNARTSQIKTIPPTHLCFSYGRLSEDPVEGRGGEARLDFGILFGHAEVLQIRLYHARL
jgi:hypothetical protein